MRNAQKGKTMFRIDVTYEQEWTVDECAKVREMYAETRDYDLVNAYFDDFGLCDDAMLSWAIELGWDIESVSIGIAETLCFEFYRDPDSEFYYFGKIVNDAIGFIEGKLPPITQRTIE